tara:strand:+ start:1935 stop:2384 length:450 start_codon:yes stop_codon:yes gene_type:complete
VIGEDLDATTTGRSAERYLDRIPSGPALANVIKGFLSQGFSVYVPGWAGLITAIEPTGSSFQDPWVALTDEGGLFIEPTTRTVEDSFGNLYEWPSTLTTIEGQFFNERTGETVPVLPLENEGTGFTSEAEPFNFVPWAIAAAAAFVFLR